MATCERCNNLLPRTVDQCPVCGLLIDLEPATPSEFAAPTTPGWANASPSKVDATLDPFEQSSVWGPESEAPSPFTTGDPSPTDFEASDPAIGPEAYGDVADPLLSQTPVYRPPSDQQSIYQAPGFSSGRPAPSAEPIPEPVPDLSYMLDPAGPDPTSQPPPPPTSLTPYESSKRPQRMGHDGMASGTGVDPIPGSTKDAAIVDDSTRTVRAFSSRIEGDIKFGRSPSHNALTNGLLVLGLGALALGAFAGLSVASASEGYEAFEQEADPVVETSLDLAAFAEEHSGNLVQVQMNSCAIRTTAFGIATDATTVLVPWSLVQTDATPFVSTADGERSSAQVLGVGWSQDLAVVRLNRPLTSGGYQWAGASQAPAGTELVVLDNQGRSRRTEAVVVTDQVRNSDGIIGKLLIGDVSLEPFSAVLTTSGQLVGIIGIDGSSVVTADSMRVTIGQAKASPTNPATVCPVVLDQEEDQPQDG